jgi:ankyrin repeat protein
VNRVNTDPIDVVKQLNSGADIHEANGFALCCAVNNGHTTVVKLLLDFGADIHSYDDLALRNAAERQNFGMMVLLVEHGADYSVLPEFKGMKRRRVVEQLIAKAVALEISN